MDLVNTVSLFTDNNYVVIKNDNLKKFALFSGSQDELFSKPLCEILNISSEVFDDAMTKNNINENCAFILLHNHFMASNNKLALFIFYVKVEKHTDGYEFIFVNWLDLVYTAFNTLQWAHDLLITYNKKYSSVRSSVDMYVFKALYPLIVHQANSGLLGLSNENIYNTLYSLSNVKPKFSKDYKSNVYRRIMTNIKKIFADNYFELHDFVKLEPDLLIKCELNGRCIPDLILTQNALFEVSQDNLINSILKG